MIKKLNGKGISFVVQECDVRIFKEDKIILEANLIGNTTHLKECDIDLHTLDLINRLITQLKEME